MILLDRNVYKFKSVGLSYYITIRRGGRGRKKKGEKREEKEGGWEKERRRERNSGIDRSETNKVEPK